MNLRATTAETALGMGGEYSVFLLVDVKNASRGIFSSPAAYQRALEELVPAEFRGMAVLFDETLLASWYPKVGMHDATYQIMQPLQLFGAFYPEFAHVWQLEVDLRFTGHAGRYLARLEGWGREQPRKQAAERSTWFFMEGVHGDYAEVVKGVNESLAGGGGIGWGRGQSPRDIPHRAGAGGRRPGRQLCVGRRRRGGFHLARPVRQHAAPARLGVAQLAAGVPVPAPRVDVPACHGAGEPRAAGAVLPRAGGTGLAMHSEATLSSFALWHGLKLVAPPQPVFQDPRWEVEAMNEVYNGAGKAAEHKTKGMVGMANGEAMYRMTPWDAVTQAASFWWASAFPGRIYDAWLDRGGNGTAPEMPYLLWKGEDGKVYAPNMMLHPVKTNSEHAAGKGRARGGRVGGHWERGGWSGVGAGRGWVLVVEEADGEVGWGRRELCSFEEG